MLVLLENNGWIKLDCGNIYGWPLMYENQQIYLWGWWWYLWCCGGGDKVDDDKIENGGLECKKKRISNFCC